jgi:hypothetical protein
MRIRSLVLGGWLMVVGAPALAADPAPPILVRGTIARIDAKSISIARADGTPFTASLAPGTSFSTVEPRRFEQIKASDFVGITTVPGPNDTAQAEEIHIIPEKGFQEGSYPWDRRPDGAKPDAARGVTHGTVAVVDDEHPAEYTMTNASVTGSSGMQLKVTYQGSTMVGGKCTGHAPKGDGKPCTGVAVVDVSPVTPIVAIVPGKATDAKAGLAVFAIVATDPQGKRTALRMILEKNGVKPPL